MTSLVRRLAGPALPLLPEEVNVSAHLRARAAEHPDRCAIRTHGGGSTSFGELEERCDAIATGLRRLGLRRGDRASVFLPPGPDFVAVFHALMRLGCVPVLIDPGMGMKSLLACVASVRPRALIGVRRLQALRMLFPRAFREVEFFVTTGRSLRWTGSSLAAFLRARTSRVEIAPTASFEEAAILFTSGSTGPPKGVTYCHGMFQAQLESLRRLYDLRSGEVDAACFPLFALFDNALGMTSVFPDVSPSRPATCDPASLHRTIEETGASFAFASPAVWRRVVPWARGTGARFTTLSRVTIAGAPVSPRLVAELRDLLAEGGDAHTPYGATEALPVASISGSELEDGPRTRAESGEGTCVGRPAPGIEIRLVRVDDGPLGGWHEGAWDEAWEVPPGDVGEICVRGPMVTNEYKFDWQSTRTAKIFDGSEVWHRMGDLGRMDEDGRLWFLGRKAHRIETARGTVLPDPVENVFNTCPLVRRSALVGVGRRGAERPHLVVEVEPGVAHAAVEARIGELVHRHGLEGRLRGELGGIHYRRELPLDVRHNAKIRREELKRELESGR